MSKNNLGYMKMSGKYNSHVVAVFVLVVVLIADNVCCSFPHEELPGQTQVDIQGAIDYCVCTGRNNYMEPRQKILKRNNELISGLLKLNEDKIRKMLQY